jgi:hypothetical protein
MLKFPGDRIRLRSEFSCGAVCITFCNDFLSSPSVFLHPVRVGCGLRKFSTRQEKAEPTYAMQPYGMQQDTMQQIAIHQPAVHQEAYA